MASATVDLHRPKVELFDLDARTNTDPKGLVRQVEQFRVERYGLYMARAVVGHPRIAYLESWFLPELGLRANDFWHHPGDERPWDTYVDIGDCEVDGGVWRFVDHYLDIGLNTGRSLEVLDCDELVAALGAGYIDAPTAQHAMEVTFRAVAGIAAHGYRLGPWLAGLGMPLTWQRR